MKLFSRSMMRFHKLRFRRLALCWLGFSRSTITAFGCCRLQCRVNWRLIRRQSDADNCSRELAAANDKLQSEHTQVLPTPSSFESTNISAGILGSGGSRHLQTKLTHGTDHLGQCLKANLKASLRVAQGRAQSRSPAGWSGFQVRLSC